MPTFWENVLRFPRFFISSVIGLLLIIFGPALNLLRKPQTAVFFLFAFGSLIDGFGFKTAFILTMICYGYILYYGMIKTFKTIK